MKKTDAYTKAESDVGYLKKNEASKTYVKKTYGNFYLTKTLAASTYTPIGTSYTKAESDSRYSTGSSGGGLSSSGFTMAGDIDMSSHEVKALGSPTTNTSATNKNYVDNNFLSLHGGTIIGNITISGQSITDLNPTPLNNNDAVTKSYVDNAIKLIGGLSITGLTMLGDICMDIMLLDLWTPPRTIWLLAKATSNFLDIAGGPMVGDIGMNRHDVTHLPNVPPTDNSAVSKKWVTDQFPTKSEVLNGFTLSGPLDLSGNEVYGLPLAPTSTTSATSKKYVDDEIAKISTTSGSNALLKSGGTMSGDINMGGFEVIGVTSVPSFNNFLVNKKYVDDEIISAGVSGVTQAQADSRYVRKTKLTLGEWEDMYDDVDKTTYCWSHNVRGDKSNIGIKTISFMTNTTATELAKLTVDFRLGHFRTSMHYEVLTSVDLSSCAKATTHFGKSGSMTMFEIDDEVFIGNSSAVTSDAILYQIGIKFSPSSVSLVGKVKACVSYILNAAGQFG